MNKILTIKNLGKTYYTPNGEVIAISNINLDIYKGEINAIIGESGCGKSSLLTILAGLEKPTNGNFKFNIDNPKIGYMLQTDALFPWLTIYENCLLGLKITKNNSLENKKYVLNLLKKYKLEEFKDKYPDELSGGMKQRVALIRTLALKPDILLLDEPFSALDYQSRLTVSKDVINIIKKEKITTILVTHNIDEAIKLANKIIVLSNRPCTIKNIYNNINKEEKEDYDKLYTKIWEDLKSHVK